MSRSDRACGVLLHPTSLPATAASGTFGAAARDWIDLLGREGIEVWQLLPLAPTDGTGSPYSSPSGSALNPWLIDADDLLAAGLITASDHGQLPGGSTARLDIAMANARAEAITAALERHWSGQGEERQRAFRRWRQQQRAWLEDHALFMVIRRQQRGRPWWEWPAPLARRERGALGRLAQEHQRELLAEALLQWQLQEQWQQLRQRAVDRGVRLLGDLPFYVAHDSADVWRRPRLFTVGRDGELLIQSGVPPRLLLGHRPAVGNPRLPLVAPQAGGIPLVA